MLNLLHCRRGSAAFATVVALAPLIGAVALGGEAASWYVVKQYAQNAADAAAYSGAITLSCSLGASCNNENSTVVYRGKEFAAQNGFCNAGDTGYPGSTCHATAATQSVAITILTAWNGKAGNFVKATVQQTQPTYLAGVLGLKTIQIGATAVAQVTVTNTPPTSCASNCGCILQTDANPTGGIGLNVNNGATVTLNTCGASIDATGTSALSVTGGAQLTAPSVTVAGGTSVNNGGQINSSGSCKTNCLSNTGKSAADPYAAIAMPANSGGTTSWSCGGGATCSVSPGVSNSSISLGNGSTFNLQPGVYFVNNGITIGGGVTLNAPGVTFVITGGAVNIANGANITLTAPTTGATAGIAFFGSRSGTESNVNTFAGGATLKITGALYFPTQTLSFSNGVNNSGSSCTQIIGGSISIVGGATLNSTNCPAGVLPIAPKNTTSDPILLVQ